jgi:hypothetical protein
MLAHASAAFLLLPLHVAAQLPAVVVMAACSVGLSALHHQSRQVCLWDLITLSFMDLLIEKVLR